MWKLESYIPKQKNTQIDFISFHFLPQFFSGVFSKTLLFPLLLSPPAAMGKGPGLFSDIGKKAKGTLLFYSVLNLFFPLSLSLTIFIMLFLYHLLFFQFFSRSVDEGLQLRSEIYCLHLQRFWSGEILIDCFSLSRSRFLLIFFLLFRFSKNS